MSDQHPKILIVDDEEDIADLYAAGLDDDYEVAVAYGGEEALETIDESFDIVFLDRRMPQLSGGEVLTALQARDLGVRVAMITAVDPGFDITEMPFDAYLTKPISVDELNAMAEQLATLSTFEERATELFSVSQKIAALQTEYSQPELDDNDEYAQLQARQATLDDTVDEMLSDADQSTLQKILGSLDESSRLH